MANKRSFRSLTVKLLVTLLLSVILGLLTFFLCRFAGQQLIERFYLSPAQVENRISSDMDSFRSFVADLQVSSTNTQAVNQWNREHPYVRLVILGRDTIISSDHYGAELMFSDSGVSLLLGTHTDTEFPVNFADGSYIVRISNHSENRLYLIVDVISGAIGVLMFLIPLMIYERRVTASILKLNRQVRQVSRGDLQRHIHISTHDEIGQLAQDVETMRLSVIDQLRREEDAWQANTQLITAISHDIRTPLTALMGYLDILSDPSLPSEVQHAYLDICRSNALRLKDLTDELFSFFLVFGQRSPELHPEQFDAATLMEQILLEATEDLQQHDFQVQLFLPEDLTGSLSVDLGHLRRVFENLFSNLKKYADPASPITITGTSENGILSISITNTILMTAGKVESNKIGLKTCDKLLSAMGGSFRQINTADTFTAVVNLPLQ